MAAFGAAVATRQLPVRPLLLLVLATWSAVCLAACGAPDTTAPPAVETPATPVTSYRQQALAALDAGDSKAALAAVNTALQTAGDDPQLLNLRGVIYQHLGDHTAAIADFDRALALDDTAAEYYTNRGLSHRANGDWQQAASDLQAAVQLAPTLATAHYNLAVFYYDTGFPDQALPLLQRAAELNPADSDIWFELALALDQQGQPQQAVAALSRAIDLDKGFDDKSFLLRGVLYAELGQDALAEQDFDAALQRGLRDADAIFYRGLMRYRRGDLPGAQADFGEAVAIDPDFAEGWYHLAFVAAVLGNQEAARDYAQRALELDPPLPDDVPD